MQQRKRQLYSLFSAQTQGVFSQTTKEHAAYLLKQEAERLFIEACQTAEENFSEALLLLQKAANAGHAVSCEYLGDFYNPISEALDSLVRFIGDKRYFIDKEWALNHLKTHDEKDINLSVHFYWLGYEQGVDRCITAISSRFSDLIACTKMTDHTLLSIAQKIIVNLINQALAAHYPTISQIEMISDTQECGLTERFHLIDDLIYDARVLQTEDSERAKKFIRGLQDIMRIEKQYLDLIPTKNFIPTKNQAQEERSLYTALSKLYALCGLFSTKLDSALSLKVKKASEKEPTSVQFRP